jgi:hypothetical protein
LLSQENVRVSIPGRLALVAAFLSAVVPLAACSSPPASTLAKRRAANSSDPTEAQPTTRKDAPQATPSSGDPPSSSSSSDDGTSGSPATPPAPAPDAGSPPPPATPAPPGSCENPKCLAGGGLCGCKATDSAGDLVTLGCQDGVCGCFSGAELTTSFDGETCDTGDDARSLCLAYCGCY